MRLAQVFKRLLGMERERVVGVEITEEAHGDAIVVVDVALRARRRMFCSGCGQRAALGLRSPGHKLASSRPVSCAVRDPLRDPPGRLPDCGVRGERVAWARAGSRFTRVFEDTCVWLAAPPEEHGRPVQRVDWQTVGRMIERVVTEHTATRSGDGLDGLRRIGIDEVADRKVHRYLTRATDDDSGRLVWAAPAGASRPRPRSSKRWVPSAAGRSRRCRWRFTAGRTAPPRSLPQRQDLRRSLPRDPARHPGPRRAAGAGRGSSYANDPERARGSKERASRSYGAL